MFRMAMMGLLIVTIGIVAGNVVFELFQLFR